MGNENKAGMSRRDFLRFAGLVTTVGVLDALVPPGPTEAAEVVAAPEVAPIPKIISIPVVVGEDTIIESTTITETVTVGTVNSNNINYRLQPDTDEKVDDGEGNLVSNILGDLDRGAKVMVDTGTEPTTNDNLPWIRVFVSENKIDPQTGETIKVEQPAWMASGFLTQRTETTHTTQEKEIDTPIAGHKIAVTDLLFLYDLEQTGGSQLNLDIAKAYGIPVTTEGEGENTKLNNPVDTEVNTNAAIAYIRATYLAGMAVLTDPLGMGIHDAGRVDVGGSGDSSLYMYSQSFSKNGQTYVEVTSGVGSRFMVTRYKVEDVPAQGVELARKRLIMEQVSLDSGADIYGKYGGKASFASGLSRIGDESTFEATNNGGLALNPEAPEEIRDIVEGAVTSDAYRLYLANISSGGAYVEPPVSFKDLSQGEEIVIEQTESGRYEARVVDAKGGVVRNWSYLELDESTGRWVRSPESQEISTAVKPYIEAHGYDEQEVSERLQSREHKLDSGEVIIEYYDPTTGVPLLDANVGPKNEIVYSDGMKNVVKASGIDFGFFVDPRYAQQSSKEFMAKNATTIAPGAFAHNYLTTGPDVLVDPQRRALADSWIAFAKQQGMEITAGNYLAYDKEFNEWLQTELSSGRMNQEQALVHHEARIAATIKAFPDVDTWYLNELLGTWNKNKTFNAGVVGGEMRGWQDGDMQIIERLARAAKTAADEVEIEKGKKVQIGLNDYTSLTETGKDNSVTGSKRDHMVEVANALASRGLIDVLGMQFGFDRAGAPSSNDIRAAVSGINVPVEITELTGPFTPDEYYQLMTALLGTSIVGIKVWTDKSGHLGLFGASNKPSKEYYQVKRAYSDKVFSSDK